MKPKLLKLFLFVFIFNLSLSAQYPANSPVALNGKLKISGIKLVNASGADYQLKGFATHGPQWYPNCYSQSSFNAMYTSWGANVIRLSMYVANGGYNNDPVGWKTKLDQMVDWCATAGVYCIIDWHVLTPGNPLDTTYKRAEEFWTYMATKHKDKDHVLYEICNEPNGTGVDWPTIKSYADWIIPKIRAIDPTSIIICGTPHYSSQPQQVISNKLNYPNIMYTLHVYAGSNTSYNNVKNNIIPYIPIILTEFGTCDDSGNTNFDAVSSNTWLDIFDGANPSGVKISWCNWAFSDKAETASALQPGSCLAENWSNATAGGALVKARMSTPVVSSTIASTGTVGTAFTYNITALNNPTSFGATGLPAGLSVNTSTGIISGAPTTAGTYTTIVKATNASGTGTKALTITINAICTPYGGTAWSIPGTIQAENYDDGGEGVAYHDNESLNQGGQQRNNQGVDVGGTGDATGTYDLGWLNQGEWLKYTVNVASANAYTLQVRVASPNTGRSFHVEIDGTTIATVVVPNTTSWQVYQTVNVTTTSISAGKHMMRIYMDAGGFNLNYLSFVPIAPPVISSELTATGQAGAVFAYAITASNAPTNYGITNLPVGLTLNATTGVISGTPTIAGTYYTTVSATNMGGTGSQSVIFTIVPETPVVSSSVTATGQVGSVFTYTITASNAPKNYGVTDLPAGLSVNSSTGVIGGTPTAAGTYTSIISATNSGGTGTQSVTITINAICTPYGGTPWSIPGTIQAENYDDGGEGIAYHDNESLNQGGQQRINQSVDIGGTGDATGTYDLGWINQGEWLKYTINVATTSTYTLQVRVASPNTGRSFHVEIDGATIATVIVPNTTGWQLYQTVNVTTTNITAGKHSMRIYMDAGGFNLNYVSFVPTISAPIISSATAVNGQVGSLFTYSITASNTPTSFGATSLPAGLSVNSITGVISGTPATAGTFTTNVSASNTGGTGTKSITIIINNPISTPYGGTPWSIPGTIQAENYDDGGEGLAYHDNESINQGNQQRINQGIDVEKTGDATGTYNVGWTSSGEWLKYTVNVATTGKYTLQVRVASPYTGKSLHVEIDGTTIATVAIPNTTGWQVYQTISVTTTNITAGKHIMRIYMDTDGFNLNYVSFNSVSNVSVAKGQAVNTTTDNAIESATNVENTFAPEEISIRLYPNPVENGVLKVDGIPVSLTGPTDIQIWNGIGILIQKISIENTSQFQLDVSALTPGVYLFEVTSDGYKSIRKFMVQ